MAKLHFTNKAVDDLSEIWNYTVDNWSENQADKYYELLIEACNELAAKPSLGYNYTQINKNILGYRAGKHLIFFRVLSENEIEIIRILHEMMDLKKRL
jgi:toxin ParE1/3/4